VIEITGIHGLVMPLYAIGKNAAYGKRGKEEKEKGGKKKRKKKKRKKKKRKKKKRICKTSQFPHQKNL